MEKDRQFNLIFNDGSVVVEASFIESKSEVVRDMQSTERLGVIDLSQFSKHDWEDYCAGSNDLRLFHLIDYLHLQTSGLIETITEQLDEEVIRERLIKLSLNELEDFFSFITKLGPEYGGTTLNLVTDILSRSDEILETSRSYLPFPIPDNFNQRLETFLKGIHWELTPGVILAGGALMTLLSDRNLSEVDSSEDLDLFIYGPDEEVKQELQRDLILQLTKGKRVKGVWDHLGGKITLTYQDGERTIQIIRSEYSIPSQIPNFFDLDHLKGYLSVDGLFLHPMFIRALKFNRVSIDLETIKMRRILKCLRYDYSTGPGSSLWKEVVKFLESKGPEEGILLGRVHHLPTEYSLGRLREKLDHPIHSKDQLISFLKESIDPFVEQIEVLKSIPVDLPENCRWWLENSPEDDYPYSIREKSLIVSLDDPVEVRQEILKKIEKIKLLDCLVTVRWRHYALSQSIILRFHGLNIQERNGRYYCSFANGDNPRSLFLEEISQAFGSIVPATKYHELRIPLRPYPLVSDESNSMNLSLDLLETTGFSNHMRVDLDLQIGWFMVTASGIAVFKKHVTYMKVLEHL